MLSLKVSLASTILTFVLFTGVMTLGSADLAYGQFFEDSDTNNTDTNTNSSSTESDGSNAAEIALLSQKLKKSSFGYRPLVGQVKNIGNDTAQFVQIVVTTYDKNGDVIGTANGFATATSLKPNQKSAFQLSSQNQNFKGMDHYEISLQWRNPDFSEGYVENAKIYKSNTTDTSD
jgi:hypothetical protein